MGTKIVAAILTEAETAMRHLERFDAVWSDDNDWADNWNDYGEHEDSWVDADEHIDDYMDFTYD